MIVRKTRARRCHGFAGASAVLGLLLLGGCSSVPDWANPVEWYEGTADLFRDEDPELARARAEAKAKEGTGPGADQQFPNLATVPDRPRDVASPEGRRRVQEGLAADRESARYVSLSPGDNPPPVITPPPAPPGMASAGDETPRAPLARGETRPPPLPDPPGAASASGGTGSDDTLRRTYREALAQSAPTVTTAPAGMAGGTDATAPGPVRRNTMPVPAAPRGTVALSRPAPPGPPQAGTRDEVLAGLAQPAPAVAEPAPSRPPLASMSKRAATIYFANGSSRLSENDRKVLRSVVGMKKERGGRLRVVGHASSRTRDVDPMRHRLVNFRISMDRANAVARALVRMGVPASEVSVAARADNEPVYYEFMPAGEAGNRRAEIYLDY
ncbi:MAG TPA: OmpA family protein [Alphaproteobacteria bacterium]